MNGDIIEVRLIGDQDHDSIHDAGDKAAPFITRLHSYGKKINGLIDISKQGKATAGSNREALKLLDAIPFSKMAVVGGNKQLKEIARLVIAATGKTDSTKLFDDRQLALDWLRN